MELLFSKSADRIWIVESSECDNSERVKEANNILIELSKEPARKRKNEWRAYKCGNHIGRAMKILLDLGYKQIDECRCSYCLNPCRCWVCKDKNPSTCIYCIMDTDARVGAHDEKSTQNA